MTIANPKAVALTIALVSIIATSACTRLPAPSTSSGAGKILEVTVGPARLACYGAFRQLCHIVDGEFFYESIDGFDYEPGYTYRLRVRRYDRWLGRDEPPQDVGRYGYRLVETISKTHAEGRVSEVTVGPVWGLCPDGYATCIQVDGEVLDGVIDGFNYEPGYEYHLRVVGYEYNALALLEIVSKTRVKGTVTEITVGPELVPCYKDAPPEHSCIVINGTPFTGSIEGLKRQDGYHYRLRVEIHDHFPGIEHPPGGGSRYSYRLLEILEETSTDGE